MLPAPVFAYVLPRNGRVQLLWEGVTGAATYTVYRDGTPAAANLDCNLWVDFGRANGAPCAYAVSATDADGHEGPLSEVVTVTPAAPTATQFRYRQVLGELLRWLVATDGVPAINAAFAGQGGTPLLTLTQADVVRGQVYATDSATLAVDVLGETIVERFMDGLSSVVFSSQVLFLLPKAGQNRPEDRSFAGDVVMDNLRALLGCQANALLPALSPQTGHWTLPGRAVFKDCHPTRVVRLNQPIKMENGVSRVPAWILTHQASLEMSPHDLERS